MHRVNTKKGENSNVVVIGSLVCVTVTSSSYFPSGLQYKISEFLTMLHIQIAAAQRTVYTVNQVPSIYSRPLTATVTYLFIILHEASLIVLNLSVLVYGSSCNFLIFSLIFYSFISLYIFLACQPALGIPLNRKKRSKNEAEK